MNLKEAHETEVLLSTVFRDVRVNGSEKKPVVLARDHFVMPADFGCKHEVKLVAKNITACIKNGYLSSGQAGTEISYARVVFCQRCDFVIESEH